MKITFTLECDVIPTLTGETNKQLTIENLVPPRGSTRIRINTMKKPKKLT